VERLKKQTKTIWIIVSIVLLLSILTIYVASLTGGKGLSNENIQVIGTPAFGYISCEPSVPPTRTMTPLNGGVAGRINPSAFNAGYISDYTITLTTPVDSNLLQDEDRLLYSICNVNGNGCDYKDISKELPNAKQSYSITLPLATSQQYVQFEYQDRCSFGESTTGCVNGWKTQTSTNRQITVTGSYRPFSLFKHDTFGGGKIALSETCADPVSVSESNNIDLVLSTTLSNVDTKSTSTKSLIVGESWNYISKPAISSLEEVETYNGQNAQCINKVMYGFDTIKTLNGNEYIVVNLNKKIATVDCCNSDILPNYQCIDHKWVSKETERQCSTLKPCPMEGSWNVNTDDTTRTSQITQTCENNICVTQTRKVECANSYACSEGYSCSDEFKCVQTSIIGEGLIVDTCGNSVCEGNENPTNCPSDCKEKSKSNIGIITFLIGLIIGTLAGTLWMAFGTPIRLIKKKWLKWTVAILIGLVMGVIVGFIAIYIVKFVLWIKGAISSINGII